MTAEEDNKKEENLEVKGTREITFRCKFCGESKPIGEMRVLTAFFPPLIACRDCEKKMPELRG